MAAASPTSSSTTTTAISITSLPEVCCRGIARFLLKSGSCRVEIVTTSGVGALAETCHWASTTFLQYQDSVRLFSRWEENKPAEEKDQKDMQEEEEEDLAERAREVIPSLLARRPHIKRLIVLDEVRPWGKRGEGSHLATSSLSFMPFL